MLPVNEYDMEHLLMDSRLLLGVLEQARHLLDWEGEAIVPEGPEEALIDYMARHHATGNPLALALLYTFRHLYGNGAARIHRQVNRYAGAIEQFAGRYGPGPVTLGRAPARINILGEHVDYVRYIPTEVLPFASREHDMLILFRPTDRPRVRGCSTLPTAEPAEFSADEGPREKRAPGQSLEDHWLAWLHRVGTPRRHWINYAKASVFFCGMKYGRLDRGFDFLLDSTIPAAGGASSSSAVVVLSGAAARVANHLPFDAGSLAEDSALAEWYIGTRGGNMDHYTMCLSRRQSALHLNFSPFKTSPVPLHRFRYRWVAFFSHPADKSGDVFLKFNERSAVSRLLIPALLERLCRQDPAFGERWSGVVKTLSTQRDQALAGYEAREILGLLPESVTLTEIRRDFPAVYAELERGYPRLAKEMGGRPIAIRPRALHHAGEVVRVREAVRILQEIFSSRMPEAPEKTEPGLRAVGDLITETHESLRDLYELTTPDIDELTDIILGHPGVYGARLMGGGFGGNVLALVSKEHVAELVDRVQSGYYAPRGRNGLAEGSVTVSTPGEGFGLLCLRDVLRRAVVNASAIWWKWETYAPVIEKATCELLGIPHPCAFKLLRPIQPVIVAGGRGKLRLGRGYRSPAALNVIDGKPSIARVLDSLAAMPFKTLPPIIVVSPAMKSRLLKEIRLPRGTRVAVQQEPLGTGHAVLTAIPEIRHGEADVLVVWGSQPLLSAETLARSVVAYQALGSSSMLFPAAVTRTPYAPIQRDLHGYVDRLARDRRRRGADQAPRRDERRRFSPQRAHSQGDAPRPARGDVGRNGGPIQDQVRRAGLPERDGARAGARRHAGDRPAHRARGGKPRPAEPLRLRRSPPHRCEARREEELNH